MKAKNILIVEDDPLEGEHIALHLEQAGHHCAAIVQTGEACLARLAQGGIDLLIVDIVLASDLDGIETVARAKTFTDIPVIYITAHVSDDSLRRAERTLPFAYLLKPYDQRELEFLITMSLTRVQVERELRDKQRQANERLHRALAIIENTAEGVMVTDADNLIISTNRAFTDITGYDLADVLGKTPALLQSQRNDDRVHAAIWQSVRDSGHWQGEIWSRRKNGEDYPEWLTLNVLKDNQGNVTHHFGIFSDMTELKHTEAQLQHLAHHDPLTDLPNRLLLNTRLNYVLHSCQRHENHCGLLYLDVDRFKLINDSLGHGGGDQVLQQVAARLRSVLRETDMVARVGGDEFVILLEEITNAIDASLVADNLIAVMNEPITLGEREFTLTCSIGIATYPNDAASSDDLIRNADAAMYRAKELGRANYQFYTQELTDKAQARADLFNALRSGLSNNEFELFYQPLVDLSTDRVCGMEALIRWHRGGQELMLPDHFIKEAEESGLIVPIGEWVLKTACEQMVKWQSAGLEIPVISVNVSSIQLHRSDLLATICNALRITGLNPRYIELEITESHILDLTPAHETALQSLQAMGVRIAIDDFGTGLSSLSRLKRLPIDKLKIDQSFVEDIPGDSNDAAIVRSIIALAKSLGIKVLAEGIEHAHQQHFLVNAGCDQGQGYIFSHPLPSADFESRYLH